MVKKRDWKTVEMPVEAEEFVLEKTLTQEEISLIEEGHRPQEMEDKWFMYYEDNRLFIHRSWTGYCIYIVDISTSGRLKAVVNRDGEQYREKDIERDKIQLNILLNSLIKQNGENARLMKLYIERVKDKMDLGK